MHDFTALDQAVPTTPLKSFRLKRGVCALAAAMTLASVAGGTALVAASGSTAIAGKGGTMATPMGNSWR
jgi:hypothetical protein